MINRFKSGRWALAATLSWMAGTGVIGCTGGSTSSTTDGGVPTSDGGPITGPDDASEEMAPPADSSPGPVADSTVDASADAGADADGAEAGAALAQFASVSVDLGNGDCGGAAVSKTFQVTNGGTGVLTINAASTGMVFSISPSTLTVAPGTSGMLTVSASVPADATAGAALTGSLKLTTNDTGSASVTVPLSVTPHGGTLAWASASPATADFGTAVLNVADTAIALTLTNTGNAPLTLAFGTPSDAQFSMTPGTATLAAAGTQAVKAGFTPTSTSHATATSTFAVTGRTCGTGVTQLAFSGQGGIGNVTGYPTTTVDFGFGACGGAAPADQTFSLANSGGVPVHITGAAFTGTAGFTTNALGLTIPANSLASVTIHAPALPFPSAVPGNYAATLTLTTDVASDTPHEINLTEEAQGAILAFDTTATPGFGDFGNAPVGTSATQSFSVINSGNGSSTVTLATTGVFSPGAASFTVDGSGAQADTVSFSPVSFGGAPGTLGVVGTNLCQPAPTPINLTGIGQNGGIALSTQSLTFAANCGATAAPLTLTVANPGNEPMTWSASLLAGDGSAYKFAPNGGTINPGDPPTTVTVTPNAIPQSPVNPSPSAFADTLQIKTDITGDTVHTVALSETPLGDILQLQPQALNFGPVPVNSTSPAQTFVLANNANPGSAPASVTFVSSNAAQFPLGSPTASAAAGDTSPPVAMTFVPGALAVADTTSVTLSTTDVLCAPLPAPALSATGTGTLAQVVLNVTQLVFGGVNCGTQASPQQIILTNTGNQNYTVTNIALGQAPSSYTFAMLPADGVVLANKGNQVVITVTPNPIPALVANPAQSSSTFSDVITITTNAQFDTPHALPLLEQAQGAVVDNGLASTNWSFGTVNFGSTGTFNIAIHNAGNAPVQVALGGLAQTIFGLGSNPTVESSTPGTTSIMGTFTPNAPSGSWADQGALTVTPTPGNVFCEPLPMSWNSPISFSGTASNNPTVSVSGNLSFPAVNCGSPVPGFQQLTVLNSASTAQSYSATFDYGTYYQFVGASSGIVPAGGTATITVQPLASDTTPGPNTLPGSSPYEDRVRLSVGGSNYYEPVSLTINGSALQYLYQTPPFYGYTSNGQYIYLTNSGSVPATVTPSFEGSANPANWSMQPTSQTIPVTINNNNGNNYNVFVLYYSGLASCNDRETGTLTWVAPSQCQPLAPAQILGCDNL